MACGPVFIHHSPDWLVLRYKYWPTSHTTFQCAILSCGATYEGKPRTLELKGAIRKQIGISLPQNLILLSQNLNRIGPVHPRWWLHLIVVRGFQYASDPESYWQGVPCWTGQMVGVRRRKTPKTDVESSDISSDLKHRANDARDGSSSYSNRREQSGLNGCCTAMWKANGLLMMRYTTTSTML